jgi:hypothetical protein
VGSEGKKAGVQRRAKLVGRGEAMGTTTCDAAMPFDAEKRLLSLCNAVGECEEELRVAQYDHAAGAARLVHAAAYGQDFRAQQHLHQAAECLEGPASDMDLIEGDGNDVGTEANSDFGCWRHD